MTYSSIIDKITNIALSHDEWCECEICEAAGGDNEALSNILSYTPINKIKSRKINEYNE